MLYYRVKPENDQKRLYKFHRGGGLEIVGNLIANELYTPVEIKRYFDIIRYCEPVQISKRNIYFSFGARFQNATTYSGGENK